MLERGFGGKRIRHRVKERRRTEIIINFKGDEEEEEEEEAMPFSDYKALLAWWREEKMGGGEDLPEEREREEERERIPIPICYLLGNDTQWMGWASSDLTNLAHGCNVGLRQQEIIRFFNSSLSQNFICVCENF